MMLKTLWLLIRN